MLLTGNNSTLRIEESEVLPVEGNTVTFSCPPGLALTGPNSSVCNENGEWEPDPSQLTCNNSKG